VFTSAHTDFIDPLADTAVQVVRVTDASFLYKKPNNYEDTLSIAKDVLLVVSNNEIVYGGKSFFFVTYNGQKYYAAADGVEAVESTAPVYRRGVIRHNSLTLYYRPIEDDDYEMVTLTDKKAFIDIVRRVGFYSEAVDLGFLYVTCGDYSGYAKVSRISIYENVDYNTTEPHYMYVRTAGLGKRVPLYEAATTGGVKLCTVGDGNKIILLQEYDPEREFMLVSYGAFEGYIETSLLYKSGLSYVQKMILFIVIAVCVITVAVVAARFIKKKNVAGREK
jgi:hypothetical protein